MFNDGSTLRLRPEFAKHVWSYDFMQDRTHDGKSFRILNIIDEYTRECLLAKAVRRFSHREIMGHLTDIFCEHGVPVHIRSDNGPEFIARRLRAWLDRLVVKPLFIEPGSPKASLLARKQNSLIPSTAIMRAHASETSCSTERSFIH